MATVLEHNIVATLDALRQARANGDRDNIRHHEARLNWLIERLPRHR